MLYILKKIIIFLIVDIAKGYRKRKGVATNDQLHHISVIKHLIIYRMKIEFV